MTPLQRLIFRVRRIDPAAAEYIQRRFGTNPHVQDCDSVDYLMTWSDTPQGHDYWSHINSICFYWEDRDVDVLETELGNTLVF